MISKSGAPTLDGGNSSSTMSKTSTSAISKKKTDVLMSGKPRMLKHNQLKFGREVVDPISNGQLFILIKQRKSKLRDSVLISVSILTDHSISYQDFH